MVSCIFIIRQVMELKISLTLWLVLLASVTQIGGVSVAWPLIETDVGDYPDTNTGPLLTDLNNVLSPDTCVDCSRTKRMDCSSHSCRIEQTEHGGCLNIQDSNSFTPLHVAASSARFRKRY